MSHGIVLTFSLVVAVVMAVKIVSESERGVEAEG